mgnify:CR=1 FL=1
MFKQMAVTLCTLLSLAGTTAWAAGTTAPEETTLRTVPTSFADTAASQAAASALVQVKAPAKSDTATAPVVTITPAASAPADTQSAAPKKADEKKIMLNLASRILTLYQGNTKITMYPVGVGKASTPSPTGTYSITDKEVNPTWIDPDTGTQVPSGPACPLGYRWLGLFGNYGIHGTNAPSSIGGYVSHGCIRMHEADVEDLYNRVSIGTPVIIYYDRIVIDRDPDHTISYYIYPDGYGRQPLTAEQVKQALAGYGVEDFEEYGDIYNKIRRPADVCSQGLRPLRQRPETGETGTWQGRQRLAAGLHSGFGYAHADELERRYADGNDSLRHSAGRRTQRRRLYR